jgi:hypothetical protein
MLVGILADPLLSFGDNNAVSLSDCNDDEEW